MRLLSLVLLMLVSGVCGCTDQELFRAKEVSSAEVALLQMSIEGALSRVSSPYFFFHEPTIVIAAGGAWHRIVTTIRLLKLEYKTPMPIEICAIEHELDEDQIRFVKEEFGVYVRMLPPSVRTTLGSINYHIKAACILQAESRQILFLDADNIPLRDPSYLFETSEYVDTGTLFWPDYWKTHETNPWWPIIGTTCIPENEQESGQIAIDKGRAWSALHLAAYFQDQHQTYFRFGLGDKDTFRFAWRYTRTPFAMPRLYLTVLGNEIEDVACGHTMLQHDFQDEPLFAHSNLNKKGFDAAMRAEGAYWSTQWAYEHNEMTDDSTFRPKIVSTRSGAACVQIESSKTNRVIRTAFDGAFEATYKRMYL